MLEAGQVFCFVDVPMWWGADFRTVNGVERFVTIKDRLSLEGGTTRYTARKWDGEWSCMKEETYIAEPFNADGLSFVVESTMMAGGGAGHGPHDIYPDGWSVTARLLNDERTPTVSFYQSGCFRNMVDDDHVRVLGPS